ncbi:hypothetical protein NEOLI_005241 [Neolecta irregularis DAH-3]|uniref:Uncharacterized protein n=1 Tax=Neolecta irregularis (strain DAH-3) TaxID=1198029 RepID=A0A1U7LK40_NEOID|nr:hypothetical protein NEOLI_005241 [Neolecta irregularis DAH-3]|eukprot:OLL22998.1 hypothetical protein NEOLI_005241 [Neolecta irregularis DAH-3]
MLKSHYVMKEIQLEDIHSCETSKVLPSDAMKEATMMDLIKGKLLPPFLYKSKMKFFLVLAAIAYVVLAHDYGPFSLEPLTVDGTRIVLSLYDAGSQDGVDTQVVEFSSSTSSSRPAILKLSDGIMTTIVNGETYQGYLDDKIDNLYGLIFRKPSSDQNTVTFDAYQVNEYTYLGYNGTYTSWIDLEGRLDFSGDGGCPPNFQSCSHVALLKMIQ